MMSMQEKGKRQQHDDQAARRGARCPDGGNLVAVAQFGKGEQESQQNTDGQECCKRGGGPHQNVFENDAGTAVVEGQDFLGVGDNLKGEHKNGNAEQYAEKAGDNHPGEHPADGRHDLVPHPIRRASGSQRRPMPAPNVSTTPPMRSGFRVKQVM